MRERFALSLLIMLLAGATPLFATQFGQVRLVWRSTLPVGSAQQVTATLHRTATGQINEPRLNRLIQLVLSTLADNGYRRATVEPRDFIMSGDSLSFDLGIDPGALTTIARWELAGLARTDSLWLLDVLAPPVGVPATRDAILAVISGLSRVENLSLKDAPEIVAGLDDTTVVVRLILRESPPAHLEGALAAGTADAGNSSLSGRLVLGLAGLFRRDRSFNLRYEQPLPEDRLTQIVTSERSSLWRPLSTRLRFEDWRRIDHRLSLAGDITLSLSSRHRLALDLSGAWQKITPLRSTTDPSRLYEMSVGITFGARNSSQISARAIRVRHRRWPQQARAEIADVSTRIESEASLVLRPARQLTAQFDFGSRWWESPVRQSGAEWFLGGDVLRGYAARSLIAAEGLWTRLELTGHSPSGLGASIFGEYAWLTMFDLSARRAASIGGSLLLESDGRSGRLELAWKEHASLREGILRLSVVQGW